MRTDVFQRVDRAFQAVLTAREEGRADVSITALCDGDDAIAAEVRSLLEHAGQAPSTAHDPSHGDSRERPAPTFLDPAELHRNLRGRGSSAFVAMPESTAAGEAMLGEWGASAAGQRVGDFTLIAPIGVGGMGVVFVAEQERPRRTVALKLVRRAAATPTLVRRFEREAQLLGRLNHPGIAQIFAAGVAELLADRSASEGIPPIRVPYLAMELVDGPTIFDFVRKATGPQMLALELVAQACDAVGHAHQRGVIHRDLKPANILVATDGDGAPRVKVLDFGVARDSSSDDGYTSALATITLAGHIVGTIAYMSPEQIRGGVDLDTRCDVYALGVILFELLAGRLPFEVRNCPLPEAARRIADGEPPMLSEIDRSLRGDIETIVAKALAKDPARRYQSCGDFARDLRACLAGEPIEARRDSIAYVWRQRAARYRTLLAGAALLLAITVGVAVYARMQQRQQADIAEAAVLAERRAEAARQQTNAANARLADELAASRIEQGRLLGLSGDAAGAERLLWDAHFAQPDSAAARWALREFYARSGNVLTARVGSGDVRALAILPGGDGRFATGYEQSGAVSVWSTDGRRIADIDTDLLAVHSLEMLSDDQLVAAGRCGVRIVDLKSKSARAIGPAMEAWSVNVLRTGSPMIAIGNADGSVRLVHADGRELATIAPPANQTAKPPVVRAVAFDRAGTRLAIGYDDGAVRLLTLADATADATADSVRVRPGPPIAGHAASGLMALAFSIDGQTLASGGADRKVTLWRTDTGERIATANTENGTCRGIVASRDGKYFAVSGFYGTRLFDARTAVPANIPSVPLLGASADGDFVARFTDDGTRLLAAGGKGLCHVWELSPIQRLPDPALDSTPSPAAGAAVRDLAIARRDEHFRLAAVTIDGTVTLREAAVSDAQRAGAWNVRWQTKVPDGEISSTCVGITSDASTVFVGRADGRLTLFRAEDGSPLGEFAAHAGTVTAARPVPGKPWIATGGVDGAARLWRQDGASGLTKIAEMPCDGEVIGLAVRPQADAVAVTARPASVQWFSLPDGNKLGRQSDGSTPWRPAFSTDGQRFATGAWDRGIRVWNVPATLGGPATLPTRSLELVGHTQLVLQEAFDTAHGDRLASVSNDGTLRIWNVAPQSADEPAERRRLLATLDSAAGDAIAVVALPMIGATDDSPTVITGHADGHVRFWDWRRLDRFIDGQRVRQEELRAPTTTRPE